MSSKRMLCPLGDGLLSMLALPASTCAVGKIGAVEVINNLIHFLGVFNQPSLLQPRWRRLGAAPRPETPAEAWPRQTCLPVNSDL